MNAHEKGMNAAILAFARTSEWGMPPPPSIEATISAYLEASGMVMVPREPTEEMRMAALTTPLPSLSRPLYEACWARMIDAFPSPFSQANTEAEGKP